MGLKTLWKILFYIFLSLPWVMRKKCSNPTTSDHLDLWNVDCECTKSLTRSIRDLSIQCFLSNYKYNSLFIAGFILTFLKLPISTRFTQPGPPSQDKSQSKREKKVSMGSWLNVYFLLFRTLLNMLTTIYEQNMQSIL